MVETPIGHRVPVGERKLWMHRSGDGEPVTVFVPGGGSVGLDFLLVHEQVAQLTTSVLYDRAGTGWSDDADLPRSADEVTDELRALLRTAADDALVAPVLITRGAATTRNDEHLTATANDRL